MSHISVARQACAETDMWLERAWVSVPRERLGVGQCASGAPLRELKCRATEMWLDSPLSQSTEPLSQSTEPSQTSHSFPMRERERGREREREAERPRERGAVPERQRGERERQGRADVWGQTGGEAAKRQLPHLKNIGALVFFVGARRVAAPQVSVFLLFTSEASVGSTFVGA